MNQKRILKIFDYLFLMRPMLFLPVWLMVIAGYQAAGNNNSAEHSIFYIVTLLTCMSGGVYILNQIGDTQSDHINNKLYLIAGNHIHPFRAYVQAGLCISIPLILSFYESPLLGALFLSILTLGFIYNLSWKNNAWGGLALNIIAYGGLVYSIGWLCAAPLTSHIFTASLPFGCAIGSAFLVTTLPDVQGDQQAGKRTFAVHYGTQRTLLGALILLLITGITAFMTKNTPLLMAVLLSIPFYIKGLINKNSTDPVRGIKIALTTLAISLCLKYPPLFIGIISLYALTRWYYHERFNIHYPYLFNRIL